MEEKQSNLKNPGGWLIEHEDLWDNEGDRIVFHCPLEEVPPEILEIAQAYEQTIKDDRNRLKILKQMNLLHGEETFDD